jgi:hypothetical protein
LTLPSLVRTYDPTLLLPIDPRSSTCARTWVRFFLKTQPDAQDKFPENDLQDVEYNAALTLDSVTDGTYIYFRPAVTAARLYEGNPRLLKSDGGDNWSHTRRDTPEIIAAWLVQGAAFDRLIPAGLLPLTPGLGQAATYTPRAAGRRTVL